MSGHSKWSTIKRKKGLKDQERSKIFSKLSRLISIAVQEGGGIADPEKSVPLRLAFEQARAANMPKDTIERAVAKGTGAGAVRLYELVYEAFGPSACALLILVTTDNTNRSHAEVKYILEKHGGKMGGVHSVSYLFEKCGLVSIPRQEMSESEVFSFFDKVGGSDFEEDTENYYIYIPFAKLGSIRQELGTQSSATLESIYQPKTEVLVDDVAYVKLDQLVNILEDLDDVQKVYGNYTNSQ